MAVDAASGSRRSAPGFAKNLALGGLIGAVGGGLGAALGLPLWAYVLLLVTLFLVVFLGAARHKLSAMQKVPEGTVDCPRCGQAPRTAAGWCGPCTAELEAAPVDATHPAAVFCEAMAAEDLDRASAQLANRVTIRQADGSSQMASRRGWLRNAQLVLWAYRGGVSAVETVHVDPATHDLAWARTYGHARGRATFPALELRTVTRMRLTDGLITEMTSEPALPLGNAT